MVQNVVWSWSHGDIGVGAALPSTIGTTHPIAPMQSSVSPLHGIPFGAGCCLAIIAMQSASIAIALGALAAMGTPCA